MSRIRFVASIIKAARGTAPAPAFARQVRRTGTGRRPAGSRA